MPDRKAGACAGDPYGVATVTAARTRKPPHGVVAVIEHDRRFLLIRRGPGTAAAGWWCFPGGARRPGEDEREALVREMREELGVAIRPRRRLWRAVTAWGVDLAWWQTELDPGAGAVVIRPRPEEVAEIAWLTAGEALERRLLGSNIAFFRRRSAGAATRRR